MGVSKHCSREREKKKREGSAYGQATKDIAREETGMSHMRKSTGIL